ncbi:MAG: ATP synthase F1 subunit epsilon [Pseudomonadota bacterium]
MSDATLTLDIVLPDRLMLSRPVALAVVPGALGDLGVLPRHSRLVSSLRPGTVQVFETRGGKPQACIFISGGLVDISGEACVVLADDAQDVSELAARDLAKEAANLKVRLDEAQEDEARVRLSAALELNHAQAQAVTRYASAA